MSRLAALALAAGLALSAGTAAAADAPLRLTVTSDGLDRMTGEQMHITATFDTTKPVDRVLASLALINLDENEQTVVDLPDWGAEQTQILRNVTSGTRASWTLGLAAPGNYAIYVTAISRGGELSLVQSNVLTLAIAQRTFVNLGAILPVAIGVPVATLVLLLVLARRRRKLFVSGETDE